MTKWKQGGIAITFVLASLIAPPQLWPVHSLLAALFAWVYLVYARGSEFGALGWVIGTSTIFPIVVLAAIGLGAYISWSEFWGGFGPSQVLSVAAPITAALLVVVVLRKRHAP